MWGGAELINVGYCCVGRWTITSCSCLTNLPVNSRHLNDEEGSAYKRIACATIFIFIITPPHGQPHNCLRSINDCVSGVWQPPGSQEVLSGEAPKSAGQLAGQTLRLLLHLEHGRHPAAPGRRRRR